MDTSYDIIIVGGGMVGLALACALAQRTSLSIAILEAQNEAPSWMEEQHHHRVSAIALSSQRIFKSLKVWDEIANKRVSPFTKIAVWEAASTSEIEFDSADIAEPVLGYIIENILIQTTLEEKVRTYPQVTFHSATSLLSLSETSHAMELETNKGRLTAKLVVAADGAQSQVRQQASIALHRHDYEQVAIVATVQTELAHEKVARQVFLPTGPLAFLPLAQSHRSSIVWSLPRAEATRLKAVAEETFKQELAHAFSFKLQEIKTIDKRYTFPLYKQEAEQYVKSRLALVGDAAHTVHPLAGQGVNMGLLDAASLVDVIVDAIHQRRDYASFSHLQRYERWRKADNLALLQGIDIIKNLFANEKKNIASLRSWGMDLVNRTKLVKNKFIQYAVGYRHGLPTLASPFLTKR